MICEGAPGNLGCRSGVWETLADEPDVLEELKEQKGTEEEGGEPGPHCTSHDTDTGLQEACCEGTEA